MRVPKPKGTLIPIGGGEDKEQEEVVLKRIIKETRKRSPKVCLITLATSQPKETAKTYRDAFRSIGITKVSVLNYESRTEATTEDNIKCVKDADMILFSGGDQLKLTSLLGGTGLMDLIKSRYYDEPDFVVAGTSAGAAAMSNTMIIRGSSVDAMVKGELELTNGLDLINSVFIDTHFAERGRVGRLIQTATSNPGILGVGLGEDTAVVIKKGEIMEVFGSGLVMVVDGTEITYTDLAEISHDTPITVEGLKVHVLGPGKKFIIKDKTIHKESEKREKEAV